MIRSRESFRAEAMLHKVAQQEPLAQQWEQARIHLIREALADAYRTLIGVHPAQREQLQTALSNIQQGGTASVAEVLAHLQQGS